MHIPRPFLKPTQLKTSRLLTKNYTWKSFMFRLVRPSMYCIFMYTFDWGLSDESLTLSSDMVSCSSTAMEDSV